jgi:hypothetical protein
LYGQVGYVISLEGNKLIQSLEDATAIANSVGAAIVGMKFRPCSISVLSDPSVESGDVGYVSDRKGNVYQILVTNLTYAIGKSMPIKCDAESPSRNSSTRYTEGAKIIIEARKMVTVEKTARELAIQNLASELANSSGLYMTTVQQPDDSYIYYMHDKPTLAESQVVWKLTANAFGVSTDGGVTYPYGLDANGDAILNRLYAIGIDATYITTGILKSTDGATLIDMEYGVANSDNISFVDNVANTFPLKMPFNIDDSVSQINKVLLKYTMDKFRTYSTTASSGGGSSTTSGGGGSTVISTSEEGTVTNTSDGLEGSYSFSAIGNNITTSGASGTTVDHTHNVNVGVGGSITGLSHIHSVPSGDHSHSVSIPSHTHGVSTPDHTHGLNFGIMETPITNYAIDVYIDGTLRVSIANDIANIQGIVDLTEWVTTVGWHTIELRSTTLKRISAQINIKSYIRS